MLEQDQARIGVKIKELRQARGLSLRTLGDLCELSPNTISLIERGVSSPSVATLHRLATALGVPIIAFFEQQDNYAEVVITRAEERSRSGSARVLLESLGVGLADQTLEPFLVTLKPGAGAGKPLMAHAGHELVYVLEGELEYEVAGRKYLLSEGDTLLFEAKLPHNWRNLGRDSVKFLLVFQAAVASKSVQQHLTL
jgi:transcriptional regulator with XRE-family HTH domain